MADRMTLAFLTSVYARTSDWFIRSEVREMRAMGHTVHTFSIRRPDASQLVSEEIRREHDQTDYLVPARLVQMVIATLAALLRNPGRLLSAFALSLRSGPAGIRNRIWQMLYVLEAAYLARQMLRLGVQHLHNHIGENSATVAMLASHLSGIPYSLMIHGPCIFYHPRRWALGEKVQRSSFTACISHFARSQCMVFADYGSWDRLKVVRSCPDFSFLEAEPTPLPAGAKFVWVGRICEEKGVPLLVEAAAQLAKCDLEFEIALIGDGPMRGRVEDLIARHGLGDRVRVLGWMSREQVIEQINASRAMVLSSFAEGLPMVLMEAMALHRPVVATSIAGIPELVEPGRNGWLVPAGSVDDLAEAIRQAIQMPVDALAQMGRAGAEKVKSQHHLGHEMQKLESLFRRSVEGDASANRGGTEPAELEKVADR